MIQTGIAPLPSHAQEDIDYAWISFANRIQAVIQDYGPAYTAEFQHQVQRAKYNLQVFTERNHVQPLSPF